MHTKPTHKTICEQTHHTISKHNTQNKQRRQHITETQHLQYESTSMNDYIRNTYLKPTIYINI